jgi:hypothetical protein
MGPGPRVKDWVVVFGGDEEAHYRGQWFAPRMAVCLLSTRRPTYQLYDLWTGPPCHRLGCFGTRRARFTASGESSLKRDSPHV